jgi:hypothetical protein
MTNRQLATSLGQVEDHADINYQCSGSRSVGSISFWTPRSGPGSGSWSFHHQAKIERKSFFSTLLWFLDDLWRMMQMYLQIVLSKKTGEKIFLVGVLMVTNKSGAVSGAGPGFICQRFRSTDLDPYQNVTYSEYCILHSQHTIYTVGFYGPF